jgi:hypothetical protein
VSDPGPPKLVKIDATLFPIELPCAEVLSQEIITEESGVAPGPNGEGKVPRDGPDPLSSGDNNFLSFQRGFDFFSWLTFIALNKPADNKTDIVSAGGATKAAWEDPGNFKQLGEVMQAGGAEPQTWGERSRPHECEVPYQAEKKASGGDPIIFYMTEESFDQPFKSGPLIDQNGHFALFDILMNHDMYNFIKDNHLYSKQGQRQFQKEVIFASGVNSIQDPVTKEITKPGQVGSIMLKVSWRILDKNKDAAVFGKYHRVRALVYHAAEGKSPAHCDKPVDLGLIGMHIVHKTVDRKQWVWTSFEHIDNVPEQQDVDTNHLGSPSFAFFDAKNPRKPINQLPPRPWKAEDLQKPFPEGFKSQIARVIPLTQEVKFFNRRFQALLGGGVWKNYMLVSTQWPSGNPESCARVDTDSPIIAKKQPDFTCAAAPTYLANSTLETFSQGSIPLASSSCMSCHNNAVSLQSPARRPTPPGQSAPSGQSDFTFMLEKAQ